MGAGQHRSALLLQANPRPNTRPVDAMLKKGCPFSRNWRLSGGPWHQRRLVHGQPHAGASSWEQGRSAKLGNGFSQRWGIW